MKLVVISPEQTDLREAAALAGLFRAGLDRYHIRKPDWSREELASWLRTLPESFRPHLVLHQHHDLVAELGLGGSHWRDDSGASRLLDPAARPPGAPAGAGYTSRSCHDLDSLRAALGRYDAVLFGPIFPSISKPGYGPRPGFDAEMLSGFLRERKAAVRRTSVLGLGGVAVEHLPQVAAMGFDGVAVLGAVWQTGDPVRAFRELQAACLAIESQRRAVQGQTPGPGIGSAGRRKHAGAPAVRPVASARRPPV